MSKRFFILLAIACFQAGVILGFLLAPIKKGVYCGNHNGNTYDPRGELPGNYLEMD